MKSFERKFGKLNKPIAIPVDEKMFSEVQAAKANPNFEFNAWAREVLLKNWSVVKKYAVKQG
jgi:hypothetical protein